MSKNYSQLAQEIVENVGGTENVKSVIHCMTRLRFTLKDESKANTKHLENMKGVIQVIQNGGQYQVVIGQQVGDVYEEVIKIPGINAGNSNGEEVEENSGSNEKGIKGLASTLVNTITGIFTPILGVLAASGMIKGILIVLSTIGVLSSTSGTYRILYASSDAIYTFLPIFLAYTSAKRFGANQFISVAIAGALVYPDLTAAYSAGESLTFFGIPVVLISYTSTVLPIIIATYTQSKLEKFMKKILPSVIRDLLYPVFSILIIVPLAYLIIGPVTDWLGNSLASITSTAINVAPIPVGFILCFVWPLVIMAGIHWGFIAIAINTMAISGREQMVSSTGPINFAQAGATLGVFLKTRNKELKEISGQAFIAAILAGITEPAMYGVTLKYKKPFYFVMIFGGISGAIMAASGAGATAFASLSILTWGTYMGQGFVGFVIACLVAFFGPLICTYLFGFDDSMLEPATSKTDNDNNNAIENTSIETTCNIYTPIQGNVIPLDQVSDKAFSQGAMGEGIAIVPSEGKIVAPFDGELLVLFPTKHALGLKSTSGVEILIHVGFDTVNLQGKYFNALVSQGDKVKKGQTLIEFDIEKIQEAGYSIETPVVVTSMSQYDTLQLTEKKNIEFNEILMNLK
ncbi:MAG: beta-glucoside-specific PTS transporter subunit IIABC [Erysipelotrichaceae bacterium]|nr:beta-glucoside-specific PTS transporter subunit IIABC [Erysipelotrichaceae bacterium]